MIILRQKLSRTKRKALLELIVPCIAPCFQRPELLMDFLTDTFESGGSLASLALSGLFYLIQERNLDFPHFYPKLYGLLDDTILHSKHRTRFLRLLNTFLASTHLPAVLVASFIKRLSRLCLRAPPAAIVAIVPWVYNLLKAHPVCTFMIHRELPTDQEFKDPYQHDEPDPLLSEAIGSSLWELETLQSHYHPNVATIAKIMSEQFTKESYNIEDFLDHSYSSASDLDSNLGPANEV